MIAAHLEDRENGQESALIVLEPANIARIQMGEPIVLDLAKFGLPPVQMVIAYSPDTIWVAEQVVKHGKDVLDSLRLSLMREPVYQQTGDAEHVVKTPIGPDTSL